MGGVHLVAGQRINCQDPVCKLGPCTCEARSRLRAHVPWKCSLGPELCSDCNYDRHADLLTCSVCGASEGELTTGCPGIPMDLEQKERVYAGRLDYGPDGWITKEPGDGC